MEYSPEQNQELLSKVQKGIFFGFVEMKSGFTTWEFWIAVAVILVFLVILYIIYGTSLFSIGSSAKNKENIENAENMEEVGFLENNTPDYWTPRDAYDYINDDGVLPVESEQPSLPNYQQSEPNKPAKNNKKPRITKKGEGIVRKTLEDHYQKPFPSIWPEFLRNPESNRKLELDCYNAELKIAAEYNGPQHYIWPNFTGQSYEHHVGQRRRDRYKLEVCDKLGIHLIVVPYTIDHPFIPEYVRQRLPS